MAESDDKAGNASFPAKPDNLKPSSEEVSAPGIKSQLSGDDPRFPINSSLHFFRRPIPDFRKFGTFPDYHFYKQCDEYDDADLAYKLSPAPENDSNEVKRMTIVEYIQLKKDNMAILLLVADSDGNKYCAKIWDPLHSDFRQAIIEDDLDHDPFLQARLDCMRETEAYRKLENVSGVPRFFGAFSIYLSIDRDDKCRCVQAILLEYVSGLIMKKCNADDFSIDQRQHILRRVVEIESRCYERDVYHRDIYAQNIIISESYPTLSVHIVDFDLSCPTRVPTGDGKTPAHALPGQYISPLLRWKRLDEELEDDFEPWIKGWIPESYSDWNSWIKEIFQSDNVMITDDMRSRWGWRWL